MFESIVNFFSSFPPALATFLMAMTPIGELRLSLPVAIGAYHLPIWQAFVLSITGNMVPVTFILLFAKRFHEWTDKKSGIFARTWIKQLHRAQEKFQKYEKYGLLGLMIFVGIPLPLTGAITGSLVAFVLGVPFKHAWPYIFGGVLISGIITLTVTLGALKIF